MWTFSVKIWNRIHSQPVANLPRPNPIAPTLVHLSTGATTGSPSHFSLSFSLASWLIKLLTIWKARLVLVLCFYTLRYTLFTAQHITLSLSFVLLAFLAVVVVICCGFIAFVASVLLSMTNALENWLLLRWWNGNGKCVWKIIHENA